MKISEANLKLHEALKCNYDEQETENIKKIFWEDLFNYKGGINRTLHTQEISVFNDALTKLTDNWPIQYVTGVSYFYDLKLFVDKNVLIPRPETEELVDLILSETFKEDRLKILDIGTGSGCIPIIIKSKRMQFDCTAIDVSKNAINVARKNAERHELRINFQVLDFLIEKNWNSIDSVDIIISNPPYISHDEKDKMSESTLLFEPHLALFPENRDVLIFYKKIADFGLQKLKEGGRIYLECNEFNAYLVKEIFEKKNYSKVRLNKDMQSKDRIVVASI